MEKIPVAEFHERVERIRALMARESLDLFLVYGDEYRKENLRYVSDYWPIFDRGMLAIGQTGEPILLVAPEGANLAREMSAWKTLRTVHELEPSYIPDVIDYASTRYTPLKDAFAEAAAGGLCARVKVCGVDAMSIVTHRAVEAAVGGSRLENGDPDVYRMRLIKSPAETAVLARSWEICDLGYRALLDASIVGLTETQAAAIAEGAARAAGAESVTFTIMATGARTDTAVGRATRKVIREGDMVMCALATQYEGYIASDEWPFVAGNRPTDTQRGMIRTSSPPSRPAWTRSPRAWWPATW